ncbi:MAG: hypothetical protein LKF48_10160 [Prevotella sp.]|jgi:hypothetical protein|nr:hypothetical protein [Prevotella sp.]MCH4183505.1 hypothetical protein [Prevotella sp.]MCH4213150.1 hypothetical protein [Prevotella sp.]
MEKKINFKNTDSLRVKSLPDIDVIKEDILEENPLTGLLLNKTELETKYAKRKKGGKRRFSENKKTIEDAAVLTKMQTHNSLQPEAGDEPARNTDQCNFDRLLQVATASKVKKLKEKQVWIGESLPKDRDA